MKWGPRSVQTPNGDGVLMIYEKNIYRLLSTEYELSWWTLSQKLSESRKDWFQAMYIPEEFTNCE